MSSSTRRLSGEGLEFNPTSTEKHPSPGYPYSNEPQVVQEEKCPSPVKEEKCPSSVKEERCPVGTTNYGQESAIEEEKAAKDRSIFGFKRRTFWIVLGSFGIALLVALIAVIGVLSQKVSQNKSNNAVLSSASTAAQGLNQMTVTPITSTPSSSAPNSESTLVTSTIHLSTSTSNPTKTSASGSSVTASSTGTAASCTTTAIGKCDATGCGGFNSQTLLYGSCTTGDLRGCPCLTLCGSILGPCSNCDGVNGTCYGGPYQGCGCT